MPPPAVVNVEKLYAALRQAALAAPVADMEGWWINVRCGCGQRSCSYPLRLMIRRHGGSYSLAQALGRLRCKGCGGRPRSAELTDDPQAGTTAGAPYTWRVELLRGMPPDDATPLRLMAGGDR